MKVQLARGVKDYTAEESIRMQKLIDTLRIIFERYGFSPLNTPIIERYDVLSSKFAAGSESDVMKEIFRLKDQGKRDLGLRFELTLSMCRYIAMNPNIKMPFKRYEIGRVYRDGPIKLGRMREFFQCDVDVVGSSDMMADAEIIKLALAAFKELGLDAYIEVNNRKLLNGILEEAGIPGNKLMSSIIAIDKLKKIGKKAVIDEMKKNGIPAKFANKALDFMDINILKSIKLKNPKAQEGRDELVELLGYFSSSELKNVKWERSLARGLSYYTGTVFEGYLRKSEITSSICGGGRYDEMIGKLLQSKQKIPATGISFGLVPIMEAMKIAEKKTVAKVFVIPIGDTKKESLEIAQKLREKGINSDIDLMGRGISKNLNYANSMQIPFVVFIGENELKAKKFKLKDMISGKEELLGVDSIVKKLK